MFVRALFSRLSAVQTCCSPVIQQYSRVIPFTCKTTSMMRQISCSACHFQDDSDSKRKVYKTTRDPKLEGRKRYIPRQVDVDQSVNYMNSKAYRQVYQDEPVWKPWRRNAVGNFYPPLKRTCIRNGVVSTANACPVCRDDYLVLDYRNVKLLQQFVSHITGKPLDMRSTGLCRVQYRKLQLEVAKAHDHGYLHETFALRQYNYRYYKSLVRNKKQRVQSTETSSQEQEEQKEQPSAQS